MKRALLVGIDDYDRFSSLDGCENDVNALEALLSRNEDDSPNFDCQKRTSRDGGCDGTPCSATSTGCSRLVPMSRCSLRGTRRRFGDGRGARGRRATALRDAGIASRAMLAKVAAFRRSRGRS